MTFCEIQVGGVGCSLVYRYVATLALGVADPFHEEV